MNLDELDTLIIEFGIGIYERGPRKDPNILFSYLGTLKKLKILKIKKSVIYPVGTNAKSLTQLCFALS